MKSLIPLALLIFLYSCAGDSLLPVKGPEGDPGSELNLAEFDDIPIYTTSFTAYDLFIALKRGACAAPLVDRPKYQDLIMFLLLSGSTIATRRHSSNTQIPR